MEMIDNSNELINGAEGVVIHNGNVVLGMQKPKRWYELPNGEKATIIKTLGGEIEEKDENSSKRALVREVLEEVEGIEEKDLKHIFDRFYKGKNSSENSFGIGLSLSKSILEKQNASITSASRLNEGTTFKIYFYER